MPIKPTISIGIANTTRCTLFNSKYLVNKTDNIIIKGCIEVLIKQDKQIRAITFMDMMVNSARNSHHTK